jgi:hypothetical protein
MRPRYEKQLGSKFGLQDLHNKLLTGAADWDSQLLAIQERRMNACAPASGKR